MPSGCSPPASRLAGAGLGLAAVAPSYPVLVVLVFIAGIGIAAFHPEGAKFAVFLSGKKRASGMSLFNIGGNLGYALGPIIVTPLVLWLGLGPGGLLASVPVLIASVAVLGALPVPRAPAATADGGRARRRREGRRPGDAHPRGGDRAPERCLVHADRVRAALGRLAG